MLASTIENFVYYSQVNNYDAYYQLSPYIVLLLPLSISINKYEN